MRDDVGALVRQVRLKRWYWSPLWGSGGGGAAARVWLRQERGHIYIILLLSFASFHLSLFDHVTASRVLLFRLVVLYKSRASPGTTHYPRKGPILEGAWETERWEWAEKREEKKREREMRERDKRKRKEKKEKREEKRKEKYRKKRKRKRIQWEKDKLKENEKSTTKEKWIE